MEEHQDRYYANISIDEIKQYSDGSIAENGLKWLKDGKLEENPCLFMRETKLKDKWVDRV